MNTYNIFRTLCLIISLLLAGTSCKKEFLDRKPLNEASDINFYRNAADAVAGINAAYNPLQMPRMYKQEITVLGNQYNNDTGINPKNNQFSSAFQPTNERLLITWGFSYVGINRANIVLQRVPAINMDENLKKRILAEAKFLRGFYYWILAKFFGTAVILTEPVDPSALNKANAPLEEVYARIVEDFTDASKDLPWPSEYAAADLGRASKGAALGMLGKVALYRKQWQVAADHFRTIIQSDKYRLNTEYMPQFLLGGDNTPESIFEVQFQSKGPGGFAENLGGWFSGWYGVPGHGAVINYGFGGGIQPSRDFVNSIEPGDDRRKMIVTNGENYLGIPFDASKSTSGYGGLKYIVHKSAEGQAGDSPINYHVMRYADVLLMYAEALNELNSGPTTEAYNAINQVRNRAKLPDLPMGLNKQQFFNAIVQERRVELFWEAHRTFDIIRWGLAGTILTPNNGFIVGKHEKLPIPQSEINANPLIVQNKGY